MRYGYLPAQDDAGDFDAYCHEALALLQLRDYSTMEPGRYEVNDHIFFLVQKYATKTQAAARFEAHRLYADLQYIVSGEETVWVGKTADMEPLSPFDEGRDVGHYREQAPQVILKLTPGTYAVFMPDDCHKASFTLDGESHSDVVKVVIKIRIP